MVTVPAIEPIEKGHDGETACVKLPSTTDCRQHVVRVDIVDFMRCTEFCADTGNRKGEQEIDTKKNACYP